MLFDRILERFRRPADTAWMGASSQYAGDFTPIPFATLSPYNVGKPVYPIRDTSSLATQGYEKISLIWACVGLIADTAAAIPMRVYEEGSDGETTTLPNHPMRQLMRQPNPQMSEFDFYALVVTASALSPISLIEKVRSASGRVVELWPLVSSWAYPVLRNHAPPDWEYRVPGLSRPIVLKAEDVMVHRWRRRTDNSPFGLCPLEIILREIGLSNAMIDHLVRFFQSGATPQLAIIANTMGRKLRQDEIDDLNQQFMMRHGGLGNSAAPFWLGAVNDIKRVGFDFNELAWTDLRDLDDLAICQAFGVSPRKAKTRVGLEHTTQNATADVEDAEFYHETILPLLARLDGMFTLGLLSEFEPPGSQISLEFDTSKVRALQENRNARATALNPIFLGGGIPASVYAAEMGLPEPSEDFYLRSFATDAIPADDPLNKNKPKPVLPQITPFPPPADDANPDDKKLVAIKPLELTAGQGPRHQWRTAIATNNKEAIARIAEARQPSFAVFLTEQESRVLAAARRMQFSARERYESIAIEWPEEDRFLHIGTQQLWELAASQAYDFAGQSIGIGISFDLANPYLSEVIGQIGTRVTMINGTTRADIERIVTESLTEGVGIAELEARLRGLYQETYSGRSMTIARTESQVAFNSASAAGYKQSGVVSHIEMFDNAAHDTDPMGPTHTTCAQRNGLIAPLDKAGDYIASAHPNCQLALAPVLEGEV